MRWLISMGGRVRARYRFHRRNLLRNRLRTVLNAGERYDPVIEHDPCHIARYEFALRHVGSGDSVLDIACGTGYGAAMLASRARVVIGVDISDVAVAFARRRYRRDNLRFLVGDLLSYRTAADVVVSFETVEHVREPDFVSILARIAELGTRLAIGSFPFREESGRNPHHIHPNLDESVLEPLRMDGALQVYYQSPEGHIELKKPDGAIQNIVFVLRK